MSYYIGINEDLLELYVQEETLKDMEKEEQEKEYWESQLEDF